VVPLSPLDNAIVAASDPFGFTRVPFTGAASSVVSIGPADKFKRSAYGKWGWY
jgi:hypothetical protein